jgi:IS4 transposase
VILPVPPEMVERQHMRLRRQESRKGKTSDPRSYLAAGYLRLLTSLPADLASADRVASLYRMRWQIERAFKRLKSIGGSDHLPATDPKLARSWLLAKRILTLLTENLAGQVLDSPPLNQTPASAYAD